MINHLIDHQKCSMDITSLAYGVCHHADMLNTALLMIIGLLIGVIVLGTYVLKEYWGESKW